VVHPAATSLATSLPDTADRLTAPAVRDVHGGSEPGLLPRQAVF